MKKLLIIPIILGISIGEISAQNEFSKTNFVGISLGSMTFKDGISSPLKYEMPLAGLIFERQKFNQKRFNYLTTSLFYATKSTENKQFKQDFQMNVRFGRLFSISKNIFFGGESSLIINARFGNTLKFTESNPIAGNLMLNISPAVMFRKEFEKNERKFTLFDTFSAAILGLGVSGGGNSQGGIDPTVNFSALTKFYHFRNSVCMDWSKQNANAAWRVAYHWDYSTFRSPINSQFGSSSFSISRKL